MTPMAIVDWRLFLKHGEEYLATAEQAARRRPEVFTPDILYNLTAMAIEKLIMGFLMSRGDLAENHTMGDLLRAMELHAKIPADLARSLRFLDSFQEICDLDSYNRRPPTPEETGRILAIGREVERFIAGRT
ncbi:MAG: hypothetical protein OEV91_02860 [Desulfobulbaceae bacterium]|nr:hypothetical protein [Desulfobulbaceae bacterium]